MLSKKIAAELNAQINREFQAAYLYLAMAIYSDEHNMDGFSNWMKIQSQEELTHGMKIYSYLRDLGEKADLQPIEKPKSDFKSFEELLELTLANEKEVTKQLNAIASHAMEEGDMITYSFLEWFLKEQIEELALSSSVLQKVKLVKNDPNGLLLINAELKQRRPEPYVSGGHD